MQTRTNFRLLAGAAAVLCLLTLAAAWFRQSNAESVVSVTVKLPPVHTGPKPGFSFR